MKKYLCKKIYENLVGKARICVIWTKTTASLPPLSPAETPLQTVASMNNQCSLSHHTQLEGFLPRRNRASTFLILHLATVAEAKSQVSVAEKWGLPLPASCLLLDGGKPWARHANTEALLPPASAYESELPHKERQIKRTSGCCSPPTEGSGPRGKVALKEGSVIVPTPAP